MTDAAATEEARRDGAWRRALWVGALLLLGWTAAIGFHSAMEAARRPYPWNTFFFLPGARFSDLTDSWRQARGPNPYRAERVAAVSAYFPVSYLALSVGRKKMAVTFVYGVATAAAVLGLWLAWALRERRAWEGDARWATIAAIGFVASVANYPLLFALDRGNFDPLITVALAGGVALLWRGWATAGGVLLGLSAGPKGYTLAAGALWLKRRGWLGGALAGVLFVLSILLPAATFEGGLGESLRGLRDGLAAFRAGYVLGPHSAHYSNDWINAIRVTFGGPGGVDVARVVGIYERLAVGGALVLLLNAFLSRERWRELLAVVLIMLIFPNVTNDYKLVLLLPVFLEWLSSSGQGWRSTAFGACATLLFVPKHFHFLSGWPDASISCVISPLLVLGLCAATWPTADEWAAGRKALRDLARREAR